MTVGEWVQRWNMSVAPSPVAGFEGVYRRRDGGFVIRGRAVHARSGRTVTICRALTDETSPKRAYLELQALKELARCGELDGTPSTMPIWKDFAKSLFAQKVADDSINSAKGREKWATILGHIGRAEWADYRVDRVERVDLKNWRNSLPSLTWTRTRVDRKTGEKVVIKTGTYAPTTRNDWLAVARVVWKEAADTYELRDPMAGIEDFELKTWRTYTREQPNSLTPEETAFWLATFRRLYPHLYAMVLLGLATGQRPSTLRPIRRQGSSPDIDFKTGILILRRSHTIGDEVMESTKTSRKEKKNDSEILLPKSVLDVLREHVAQLEAPYPVGTWQQRKSELLFPSREGRLLSRSCLQKPFDRVTKACGLAKTITPRAMRRTFQDLTRKAGVDGVVAMAISGHATDAMRVRYSTAATPEVAKAIGKVVSIATAKPRAGRRAKRAG